MVAGIAIEVVDGGWVDGLVISGSQIQDARAALLIRRGNRANSFPTDKAALRRVLIDGVQATGAILTSSITDIPGREVEDVRLSNIQIDTVMPGKKDGCARRFRSARSVSAITDVRLVPCFGAILPSCTRLELARHQLYGTPRRMDDVTQLRVNGFATTPSSGGVPALVLTDTRNAWITGAATPDNSSALAKVAGSQTSNMLFTGCGLRGAAKLAEISTEVKAGAVRGDFNIGKDVG